MGFKTRPPETNQSSIRHIGMAETEGNTRQRARRESWRRSPVADKTTKIDLRRLVLKASGGFRGRAGSQEFAAELLQCFGWNEMPEGAEAPGKLTVVDHGKRSTREVALWWPERRTLIEVTGRDDSLDQGWQDLLRACLQLDPVPQYVVLSNQRELRLYDLARDREAPRLDIAIDQLPKYSEAFPFLAANWTPGVVPKIINVEKVSENVADLIAKLYRSLVADKENKQEDAIKFTLQCIVAMFAEDIGFFPQEYFTTLLYEGAANGDTEIRLAELFVQMNVQYGSSPEIPYFNGGLFTDPVVLPLGDDQLRALTKAAEANWSYVEPHIFGSVFQGIMDADERHASGGHYTAREDIMRIVGPTIVEPWRARISAAKTLGELKDLLKELSEFRVLDPACGSGNFLYVAYRELYRLETELLSRMYEFASVSKTEGRNRRGWGSSLRITNFFGIDINRFAVELAKTTLNMAKKIAFEERNETVAAMYGQLEMEVDRSLPLDNLDENIVCDDALFSSWPQANAIVGNPPFLGGLKIRKELGAKYLSKLKEKFPDVNGRADYCAYWFRLAHDRLAAGERAGLVATSSIRENLTREASTDYIVDNDGTIVDAVSSHPWPGEAVVHVSMVNWQRGPAEGPFSLQVDGEKYQRAEIYSHLQLHADVRMARSLGANKGGTSQGVVLGTKSFEVDASTAEEILADSSANPYVKCVAVADQVLDGRLHSGPTTFVIDMSACRTEAEARKAGAAYEYLRQHVRPEILSKGGSYKGWEKQWWQLWRPRREFYSSLGASTRVLACSRHAARPIFFFLSRSLLPTESLQLFGASDSYSFGILQSSLHWDWTVAVGSKIKGDIRYTADVWSTFPWPQGPNEATVSRVADAANSLLRAREQLMTDNGWSLRALHQAAELPGAHPLRDAQNELNAAVQAAYDVPSGQSNTEFLLELNLCVAEDEADGHPVQGPGIPAGLDPRDLRWFNDEAIRAPTEA